MLLSVILLAVLIPAASVDPVLGAGISFATNSSTSTTPSISVSLAGSYTLFLCAVGDGASGEEDFGFSELDSVSWTEDVQDLVPYTSIGHQASSPCNAAAEDAGFDLAAVIIGLANAPPYTVTTAHTSTQTTAVSLSYSVSVSSFVVILGAAGWVDFSTVTVPSGCTQREFVTGSDSDESGYVAVCSAQGPGNYNVAAAIGTQNGGSGSLAAYVFPVPTTGPVGGLIEPVNKLFILTPYLALFGLVVAVAAAIVKPREKRKS
jgi:hypothetical protein